MASKNIPKKYMLVLQKRYGGQDALEFLESGDVCITPIKAFTDQKLKAPTKKDSIVQKNTLAFYDAITNKFKSFDQFLSIIVKNVDVLNYKPSTSYIGFLNKQYMYTVKLSFNDSFLAHIALNADGNNINCHDSQTMKIVSSIVDLIEDPESDFVKRLEDTYTEQDDRFNFSRSLIDSIHIYRSTKRVIDVRNKYSNIMSDELQEDLEVFKKDFLDKIKSYKNFRELYRFRKQYLIDKNLRDELKTEEKITVENVDSFKERAEEAREKTYQRAKQKIKFYEISGQLSLFDMIKDE